MKRLLRILLNASAAVSLVLCLATVGLWARGYVVSDILHYRTRTLTAPGAVQSTGPSIGSIRGQFVAGFSREVYPRTGEPDELGNRIQWERQATGTAGQSWGWHGFNRVPMHINVRGITASGSAYYVPSWLLVLATAVSPMILFWARSRRKPLSGEGLCVACGYDLRATPERCPECGAVPPAKDARPGGAGG